MRKLGVACGLSALLIAAAVPGGWHGKVLVFPASPSGGFINSGSFGAESLGLAVNAQAFTGGYKPTNAATVKNVTCGWSVAGIAGSTGYVIEVIDVTGRTSLCSCTIGACTIAANTATACACNSALMTAGHVYNFRTKSTSDCGTYPSNVICSADLVQ